MANNLTILPPAYAFTSKSRDLDLFSNMFALVQHPISYKYVDLTVGSHKGY